MEDRQRSKFRSLSSKFSIFTALLLAWVLSVVVMWDIAHHAFNITKTVLFTVVIMMVAGAISRFTIRALTRPLALLRQGITSVRKGKFERIQVSSTRDEIEDLGESFNLMIDELVATQKEIQQHRELLEERIRQRTEDLEQAMRTALAASQAKSEFLANMSHELRTPMNGLLGMLDVVLESNLEPEQRDQLETAQRSAYSLLSLLNDILDLSKIEAGKMMLESIPFNLQLVLEDCVKAYRAKAQQKKIALHFEREPHLPTDVIGDPLRIRQIVTNLLSNAIKFTDTGWVCLRLSGEPINDQPGRIQFKIEVSDTGSGIETDKLSTIFDKFTQADGSITRKYGGTGLGLAITKRLSELQGGQVRVESKVGKGSVFTVTIPLEVAATAAAPAMEAVRNDAKPADSCSRARLLLVEDNIVNQKVVIAILRKRNYQIEIASDGREALAKLDSNGPFDLVLMDVQMPVLDGLETTRIIRRDPRWVRLPVIAMTAHAMNGDRERCLQAGMNAYISKPVQPAHLTSMIEQHLHSSAGQNPPELPANPLERALTDRLMRDEREMVADLLQVFLQLAPERIERIEAAARQSDSARLIIEAKKIAAAAEQLTSQTLANCAQRLETAASRGDFAGAQKDLDDLREEIRQLEALALR